MFSRRNLLATASLLAFGGALACCGTDSSGPLTPAQILADANGAVSGLSVSVKGLLAASAISSAQATSLNALLATAQGVLSKLSASLPATTGATGLQQVEQAVNSALSTLAALPLIPPPYNAIVGAVSVVLPELEAFIASAIPTAGVAVPRAPSPEALGRARQVLGVAVAP